MAEIHHLPCVPIAENKILDIGDALEILENIPMAELNQAELFRKKDGAMVNGYDAVMTLAMGLYQLAYAMRSHQAAQRFSSEVTIERIQP